MTDYLPPEAIKLLQTDNKIGLIAVRDGEGYPHITMISTLTAKDEKQLLFGQFCEGISKQFIRQNPQTGFLVMGMEKEVWRGKAVWKSFSNTGPEFELLNNKPLFRYNTYFGIGRVHYLELVELSEKSVIKVGETVYRAFKTRLKRLTVKGRDNGALSPISAELAGGLTSLKFIAAEDEAGFCNIMPILQAAPCASGTIAFDLPPYARELKRLKPGTKAAIFAMDMKLVGVLLQGVIRSAKGLGVFDIDRVYSPLEPLPGYIFPHEAPKAVADFS